MRVDSPVASASCGDGRNGAPFVLQRPAGEVAELRRSFAAVGAGTSRRDAGRAGRGAGARVEPAVDLAGAAGVEAQL